MDRSVYPAGAQVHVTIEDHRLNIDPTSDDVWTWNVESGTMYYMLDASNDARVIPVDGTITEALAADSNAVDGFVATSVCADCILLIEPNRQNDNLVDDVVLELVSLEDLPIRDTAEGVEGVEEVQDGDGNITTPAVTAVPAEMWFTVAEDGGPNTAVFTATDLNDESILRIADDAIRSSSATIDYDDSITGIQVEFSEATIEIQSPDDVWTSGLAIPIVVVDGDVNKNSLADDDLAVSDPNSIIPTLVTGDPFTLGEGSSDLVTWVGWKIDATNTDAADELRELLGSLTTSRADNALNYNYTDAVPFILKGITEVDEDGDGIIESISDDDATDNNAVVVQQAAKVESFSDRGILEFDVTGFSQSGMDSLNKLTANGFDRFDDNPTMTYDRLNGVDFLVIDFDSTLESLQDSLIDKSSSVGYNFLNYNVESLNGIITGIEILADGNAVHTMDLTEQKGYMNINATTVLAA